MVACLLINAALPGPIQAQTTLESGTTTVASGTNFGSILVVAVSDTATLEVLGGVASSTSAYVGQ
jgi:hypothetical protein